MEQSFFWYDLETSGLSPREQRIMQFAGQRTSLTLEPIGEPVNVLIKLSDDILPDPDAVLLTGITPQMTLADGLTEVEFLKLFYEEVATPGTIFVGYNSIRFDDEFMRFLQYRNFHDAYKWQWDGGRSKWDLLDVVRMTRALRPDDITWPFAPDGKPSNRLELLTTVNKLVHDQAHDALSDVYASIAVAKMIRGKQPKLFDYLLSVRGKKQVEQLVNAGEPFVYSSGKYANEHEKTTVAVKLADDISKQGALVYDLHFDPDEFASLSPKELVKIWRWQKDPEAKKLPVKTLKYNRCPAVAPLSVLDAASQERIKLDKKTWEANLAKLKAAKDFPAKLLEAQGMMDSQRQAEFLSNPQEVDGQLYDGFFDDHDGKQLASVQNAEPQKLAELVGTFHDSRLQQLIPLYKARNFSKNLSDEERTAWESYRLQKLTGGGQDSRLAKFLKRLQELGKTETGGQKQYLLEELQLYAESIMPLDDGA